MKDQNIIKSEFWSFFTKFSYIPWRISHNNVKTWII